MAICLGNQCRMSRAKVGVKTFDRHRDALQQELSLSVVAGKVTDLLAHITDEIQC